MRVGQSRKRDQNESEIVEALEDIGVTVHRLSEPGLPDLLCFSRREGLMLLEVKAPKGVLTLAQQLTACGPLPFAIVRSIAEALAIFGVRA